MNAHHAGECRQGSIPELQRGQVSMRLENKTRTTSQYGDPWRVRGAATYKMSLERRLERGVAALVYSNPSALSVPGSNSVPPSRVTSEKPTLPLCTQAAQANRLLT